ncbi:unnamed protein product [Triticum turgidum subsp. durum]|uniref:F-box domain-containing protein n=1 Tax=Triticum turgidum subsp. durum TaxID=4567 RepID=A0A9R1QC52_TRITD|nr:unnamed protein product [Triticum turgidum subsp. durum]
MRAGGRVGDRRARRFFSGADLAGKIAADPVSRGGARRTNISSLDDDLLLKLLRRLPIDAAVRTSVLSTRWCHLWKGVQDLSFCDLVSHTRSFSDLVREVLAGRESEEIRRLVIWIAKRSNASIFLVNPWIRIAAARVTGQFELQLPALGDDDAHGFIEVPSFSKARLLSIKAMDVELRLQRDGVFLALRGMLFTGVRLSQHGTSLGHIVTHCCPKLQILQLSRVSGIGELTLCSSSLIELRLAHVTEMVRLEVTTPVNWQGPCPRGVNFPGKTILDSLCVSESSSEVEEHSSFMDVLKRFRFTNLLTVHMPITRTTEEHQGLIEPIRLPKVEELELFLTTNGHLFAETVVSFLRRCTGLKRLQLNLVYLDDHSDCICGCRRAEVWDQAVYFGSLVELVWRAFRGTLDEKKFLLKVFWRGSLRKFTAELLGNAEQAAEIKQWLHAVCPTSCVLEFHDSTTN